MSLPSPLPQHPQPPVVDPSASVAETLPVADPFVERQFLEDERHEHRFSRVHGERDRMSTRDGERLALLERCAWSIVWLSVLVNAASLWDSWWSWPIVDALAPSLVAVSLAGLVVCWVGRSPRVWWYQVMAMAAALTSVVAQQVLNIHTRIYYQTDAAALDHVAARALAAGHNPYTTSLSSAALLLKNPTDFWTYTVTGGHIVNLSYPAGSILVYAAGFALGFRHQVVDWMDLYFWVASAILLFLLVPRWLRWLSVVVALTGFYVGFFSNGGTDAAFIPFAMIAVWRWDRYGRGREAGLARWIGPVALGLACSIKQTPWFFVPFLVVGIYVESRQAGRSPLRVVGRYLTVVAAVFTAVNLPFVVWGASAWWHGTMTPIAQPLIADGQGLVSLALHGLTGGVDLRILTVATGAALLCVLAAFAGWYEQLKRVWLLLVPAVFFFATRSLSSYFLDLFPVALVALITTEVFRVPSERLMLEAPVRRERRSRLEHLRQQRHLRQLRSRKWSRLAAAAFGVVTCASAALSFAGAPLDLAFRSASISAGGLLRSVTLTVTNRTGAAVSPHFMVDAGSPTPTGFWMTAKRQPVVIGPHGSQTVTLFPSTSTYLPPAASDYVVQAYTANPDALSTTNDIWHNSTPNNASGRPNSVQANRTSA